MQHSLTSTCLKGVKSNEAKAATSLDAGKTSCELFSLLLFIVLRKLPCIFSSFVFAVPAVEQGGVGL